MKNFIKKYPKRIIITALVVLLIAVIGTVNNYRTYWDMREKEHYLEDETVEFMREIYGDITIESNDDIRGSSLYYRNMPLVTSVARADMKKLVKISTDRSKYFPDDILKVKIENKVMNDIEFYTGKYLLQIRLEENRWYTVHSGVINAEEVGELIKLKAGEAYEIEIPLNSVREVSDEPITLIPGRYRFSKPVYVLNSAEDESAEDAWLSCEFEIK